MVCSLLIFLTFSHIKLMNSILEHLKLIPKKLIEK